MNRALPPASRIAYFPQDLIGDSLVWADQIEAFARLFAPCEAMVFCTKGVSELFGCMAFCDRVVEYDPDYGTACVVGNDTGLMHLACMLGAPSVTIVPHGHHFTWFPYAADERAKHVCLAPACATPMCVNACGETAQCAGKIPVERVAAAVEEVAK